VSVQDAAARRGKLLRRTLVGSSIALALASILWLATKFESPLPMIVLAGVALAACVWEVDRMGTLAGRGLWMPLSAGGLVALMRLWERLGGVDLDHCHDLGFGCLWLPEALLSSGLVVLAVYAACCTRSMIVRLAGLALVAAPVFVEHVFVAETGDFAVLALALFLVLRLLVIGAERRGEALAVLLLGPLLVVSILGLAWVWYGFSHLGLVALIAICKLGDSAGYYVGSTLGQHHPFKAISPGKTTEGCLGSFVVAAVSTLAFVKLDWLPGDSALCALLAGAAVSIAAQASDLLESWVKRKAGVKDSGHWFGPSGGMLDLVDSFFLATPVALVLWPFLLRL